MMNEMQTQARIITFYSYKGGTGRSMALANLAWVLAANGKRVLMMDWDLEAPGLHRYFQPFLADKELTASRGLLDLLVDYADMAIQPPVEGESDEWYEPLTDISPYILGVNFDGFPGKGRIDLLAAGRQGSSYASKLQSFDWSTFYDRLGGGNYLEALKAKLRVDYDYVLVDSRTGVTDTAGICTVQMPDTLVVVFTYNNQSIRGAQAVAQSALETRRKLRGQFSITPFRVFPVPSRVDPFEIQKLQVRQDFARRLFAPLLSHIHDQHHNSYWAGVEIPYNAYLSYEEVLSPLIFDPEDAKMPVASVLRLAKEISDGEITSYNLFLPPKQKQALLSAFAEVEPTEIEDESMQQTEMEPEIVVGKAEAALDRLDQHRLALAEILLLRFVRLPGTQEPPGLKPLILRVDDVPDNERLVFTYLVEAGVINQVPPTSSEFVSSFRLSDNALLSSWRRLAEWADSRKAILELREWVRSAQEQWLLSDKPDSLLLSKVLVERAMQLCNSDEAAFFHGGLANFLNRSIAFRSQAQTYAQGAKLHAFVAMPFGTKSNADGVPTNFDLIYSQIHKPALEKAGLEVIRVEEERFVGDIRMDMFQELLIADLVLVDLTADNPSVWYELGVRHALRSRGVVLVNGSSRTRPFDIYTDRKYSYHLKDGAPDPAHLEADINVIADMTSATLANWHDHTVSPIYSMLPNLSEPNWKTLRIGAAREFWARHDEWAALIECARKAGHSEDILVLADEAPVTALRVEARIIAGKSLLKGRHFNFALEQLELACTFDPDNLDVARLHGVCLQRLGRMDDARAAYHKILAEHPTDVETWSLLGRLDKDAWVEAWNREGSTVEQKRDDAGYEDALLLMAIDTYTTAFRVSSYHYYSGISALTLMHLYRDLTGNTRFDAEAIGMAGGIAWAAGRQQGESELFWAKATLGELAILQGDPVAVASAYKATIACADRDWFALDSTLSQLRLLAAIGFAPDRVAVGIATFERALARLQPPEQEWQPERVFLFSGHMIDAPDRKEARFPANKEDIAATAIDKALTDLGASDKDLALTQGASGGDLLFAEACVARCIKVQLLLPLPEPDFIEQSILAADGGDAWRKRYYQLRDNPLCQPPRVMPDALGPLPQDSEGKEMNPFERCNQWLLYSALAKGIARTRFLCLWNGGGGDGPGGTEHMMKEVKKRTGQVTWLDTRKMW